MAALSQRTKTSASGTASCLRRPRYNPPARVAERIAALDLLSNGRVEFGTGESASEMELGGFGVERGLKKSMWEEATREIANMMVDVPYAGFEGEHFSMPARNVIPKPLQKPHPPMWVAAVPARDDDGGGALWDRLARLRLRDARRTRRASE